MTQEDKELLLKDLCARLPYGVKVENTSFSEPQMHTLFGRVSDNEFLMLETYKSVSGEDYRRVTDDVHYTGYLESIKPYLRPMSSMTEEERQNILRAWNIKASFVGSRCDAIVSDNTWWGGKDKSEPLGFDSVPFKYMSAVIDWLNAHHFDYRGLIETGLAIEAPEGMYN